MYVDVDTCRIHLKFQEIAWLRLAGNERFVAIHYSLMEVGMTHVAPVDNKILQRIPSACIFRTGDITVNLYQRGVNIYREEMRVEIILPYIHDALLERTRTRSILRVPRSILMRILLLTNARRSNSRIILEISTLSDFRNFRRL